MRGRRPGRATKLVSAQVLESVTIGRAGITFEVWRKWKRTRRKLGTLTVSVGGLRWWPHKARSTKVELARSQGNEHVPCRVDLESSWA